MAVYSRPSHLVLCGSHAGVSIGEDGPSQMALEDLAMMRAIVRLARSSTRATPSAPSGWWRRRARTPGIVYIRTSAAQDEGALRERRALPGGRQQDAAHSRQGRGHDRGGRRHALRGADARTTRWRRRAWPRASSTSTRVKPVDVETLRRAAAETRAPRHRRGPQRVRRHRRRRGRGRRRAARRTILGVREVPRSGKPAELMATHGIDADAIVKAVRQIL